MRDPGRFDLATTEQLLRDGEVQAALRHASRALAEGDSDAGWLRLQALALAASGRAAEARQCFLGYAEQSPREADAWVNLANACLECGDTVAALEALERAAGVGAGGVPYLLAQGLALSAAGRFPEALHWLQRADALEPMAPDIRLARGQCLAELERLAELDECVEGISPAGLPFEQRTVLAWLLAQAGRDQAAQALYRQLVAERPAALLPRVQLALLLERLNRVQEAAAVLSGVEPLHAAADSLSALAFGRIARRECDWNRAIAILDDAAGRERNPAMAAQLWFELAKCHDRQDQPDAAMPALANAHRDAGTALRQRHPGLQQDRLLGWLGQRLQRPLPRRQSGPGGEPPDPVFLVGFPRSGTTLLEQMLARHPALQVLEEKPALEHAIAGMRALPGWRDDDLDASLARLDSMQWRQLRARYRSEVARHIAPQGRLVDKYPLSLTRVGHAQWLFPRSDWLLLLRHPCDCVLSCHLQAFGLNGGALAFASLESTARTYAEVMGYWHEQRPLAGPRVHTLKYEDLVTSPQEVLDGLMAFLSLPPEPAQLAFPQGVAAREQRINTPSYAQVAEPVHGRAVGHWRRYRAHFTPETLALLAPFAARYGYALD